jgi:hypothetical protein
MKDQVLEGRAMTTKRFLNVEDLEVYKECIRMWNGLEKTLEQKIPERERRWQVKEESFDYGSNGDIHSQGWPGDLYYVSCPDT